MQWRTIRFDWRVKFQAFADTHNRNSVQTDFARNNYDIAHLRHIWGDVHAFGNYTDTARVDKNTVAFAALDNFRIAGDDAHIRNFRGLAHRTHNSAKIFHLETFFDDKPRAQKQRLCAAHRHIVDRAVDCQIADVTAREEQRIDDERIRGICEPCAVLPNCI